MSILFLNIFEKADTRMSFVSKSLTALLLLILPVWLSQIDVKNKNLNIAFHNSCIAYTIDYHNLPQAERKYNDLVEYAMTMKRHGINKGETDSIEIMLDTNFTDYKDENVKALLISTVSLMKMGMSSSEFILIRNGKTTVSDSIIKKFCTQALKLYPLFKIENKAAQLYFERKVKKLVAAWKSSCAEDAFKPGQRKAGLNTFLNTVFKSDIIKEFLN